MSEENFVTISLVESPRCLFKKIQKRNITTITTELSVVCTTYPLRTLAGLSFDPPVGAFKFLDGLVFKQMKMIRTPVTFTVCK